MRDTNNLIMNIYNPANQTRSELIDNYVVRVKEFEEILYIIKNDDMQQPPQHVLIQGQRGSGKTTLLLRLLYEVKDNPQLCEWLIPIRFDEEQYNIRTLYKLWENIAIYLEDEIDNGFYGLLESMRTKFDEKNYDQVCYQILKTKLVAEKKKLVIFADNFGDMLNKFQKDEVQILFDILANENMIRFVGASSVHFWNTNIEQSLINLLKIYQLEELEYKETTDLLMKLGDYYQARSIKGIIQKERGRVEALRRLTGGVPRTIVLLYEIFIDNESGDSFRDLEAILDRVTPLYKHRMDDLSPQQQEIVHAIAMSWDAVGVREIAHETRMESKAVSAQLKQL